MDRQAPRVRRVRVHGGHLRRLGLRRGDAVALQIVECRSLLHAVWGCVLGGTPSVAVAVPARYDASEAGCQKLVAAGKLQPSLGFFRIASRIDPASDLYQSHAAAIEDALRSSGKGGG